MFYLIEGGHFSVPLNRIWYSSMCVAFFSFSSFGGMALSAVWSLLRFFSSSSSSLLLRNAKLKCTSIIQVNASPLNKFYSWCCYCKDWGETNKNEQKYNFGPKKTYPFYISISIRNSTLVFAPSSNLRILR